MVQCGSGSSRWWPWLVWGSVDVESRVMVFHGRSSFHWPLTHQRTGSSRVITALLKTSEISRKKFLEAVLRGLHSTKDRFEPVDNHFFEFSSGKFESSSSVISLHHTKDIFCRMAVLFDGERKIIAFPSIRPSAGSHHTKDCAAHLDNPKVKIATKNGVGTIPTPCFFYISIYVCAK